MGGPLLVEHLSGITNIVKPTPGDAT